MIFIDVNKSHKPDLPEKDEPIDPTTPIKQMEQEEKNRTVYNALNRLKEEQRVAIVLHNFQGLSYKEIADVQKISLSAVETRIHRGKLPSDRKGFLDQGSQSMRRQYHPCRRKGRHAALEFFGAHEKTSHFYRAH